MSDKMKEILLEQVKAFGVQVLELAGEALLKTAKELTRKQEVIEQEAK